MDNPIVVQYELTCKDAAEAHKAAKDITYEQTVELPVDFPLKEEITNCITGAIRQIELIDNERYAAEIEYAAEITGWQLPQLLNILYGNISIKNNIKIIGVEFPRQFLDKFKGPNYGVEGIRALMGVYGRPLLATALKPMGASAAELAAIASAFARGGGDIVKDDHGLVDHSFCSFKERVLKCLEVVERAADKTGRRCLYIPNVLAGFDDIERQVEFAVGHGAAGILIAPYLIGLDTARYLAANYPIVVMAHPALTGTNFHDPRHGIAPSVLLGTIFRLAGADVSIYPNVGGRFSFSLDECRRLNNALRWELGGLRPSFPAPAGGMALDNISEMAALYGPDTIYLIGGALHSHDKDLSVGTRVFMDKIAEYFSEHIANPAPKSGTAVSSCDINAGGITATNRPNIHIVFGDDYRWDGIKPMVYKSGGEFDFKDITRHELVGKNGELADFDLRYFEIGQGGYSSLEKHVHIHVIICVRGTGTLICEENSYVLRPFDIAYVPPLHVHQLRNDGSDGVFGFFCIVNHLRDKPLMPT
ncbi:RuBisCO large subunit C-terminal-like domain-containing protein [Candidatus Magnetominusculus xianensis]|uniref:Ribulose 1,5-bisphosphate carboxylase large subunit n=1 Tax=Candidatus Magnetominusculus xianensis TaxID=1748249 RepID=A0ABR5SK15_9BACT|nr:RuBisCO large subunit C-terminal-like domain-containing protein [Candidatus Magnetominusculus xianensis]KWT95165.1 ribulose 1,5-bisphosphate carboxylase large subunit [Candidatus Magnetominusculus xianensis]MBF0402812.1 cupin domain-containing protein [Nitrospirota bacterium]